MKIKTAAIQMHTVPDKMENIRTAGAYIEKVSAQKPDFVILPEMFCCPYQTENFPVYAEEEGGPAWQAMSGLAEKYQIYLIAGSMPERDADGNIFNTSYIFDRQGKQIGKHRKAHLFDINVKSDWFLPRSRAIVERTIASQPWFSLPPWAYKTIFFILASTPSSCYAVNQDAL